jgi:Bacterial protein of unknown function (DUF948)
VSGGTIAALIAACSFAALVVLLAIPLRKLGRTLDEATLTMRAAREEAPPVPPQPLPVVVGSAAIMDGRVVQLQPEAPALDPRPTRDVLPLGAVVSSTFGPSLIKAAALGYGVRTSVRKRLDAGPTRPPRKAKRSSR